MNILNGYEKPTPIDFTWKVKESEYRSDDRLNFHKLADFKRDPRAFHDGLYEIREETDAMRFGTAFHAMILEGEDAYNQKVAVFNPPVNPKTGEAYGATTNAYKEAKTSFEVANIGKTIISRQDATLIERLRDEFNFHPVAPSVLGRADWAKSEVSVCGEINLGDGTTFPVKGRIDRYSESGLVDIKTTSTLDDGTGRDKFRYAIYDYKYILQLAFYQMILIDCYGAPFVPVYILAFEKNPPNRVAVYAITPEVLTKAREVVREWIKDYRYASTRREYPSKFDTIQLISTYSVDRDLT